MKHSNILNIYDRAYTDNAFHIQIGAFCSVDFLVFADNEQEVIDLIIDHYEEQKEEYKGFFFSEEEWAELTNEEQDQYIYGGNHCLYLTFTYDEMRIKAYKADDIELLWEEKV